MNLNPGRSAPRLIRMGPKSKAPNKAQWTFRGDRVGWTWRQTASDGTTIRASTRALPSYEAAKMDARLAGWTPQQATIAHRVD